MFKVIFSLLVSVIVDPDIFLITLHLPECTTSFLLAEKEAHIHYRLYIGDAQCDAALMLHENMNAQLALTCPFNFSLSLSLACTSLPQSRPLALFHAMFAAQTLSSGAVAVLSWNQWHQSLIKSSSACLPRAGPTNHYSFPVLLRFPRISQHIVIANYERVTGSVWTWLISLDYAGSTCIFCLSHFCPGAVKNECSQGLLMKAILEASVETVSARPITTQHRQGEVWEWKGEGDAMSSRMGDEKKSVYVCI